MSPTGLAGNIARIVDPLGGVTTQTFDALGRLALRTLPNGVTSTSRGRGHLDRSRHAHPRLHLRCRRPRDRDHRGPPHHPLGPRIAIECMSRRRPPPSRRLPGGERD
jgi:YD repeat-containing protein